MVIWLVVGDGPAVELSVEMLAVAMLKAERRSWGYGSKRPTGVKHAVAMKGKEAAAIIEALTDTLTVTGQRAESDAVADGEAK